MKTKVFLLFVFFVSFRFSAVSQNVGISATGIVPNNSAMLDVVSTTRGLLIPRMTVAERALISLPATSLLIYQTDATPGYYYYDGVVWERVGTATTGGGWTDDGTVVRLTTITDSVGIGMTGPLRKLHVAGNILIESELAMSFGDPLTQSTWHIDRFELNDRFRIFRQPNVNTTGTEYFTILNTGNVGIGTTTPGYKLDVNGNLRATDIYLTDGVQIEGLSGRNYFRDVEAAGNLRVGAAWGMPGIYAEAGVGVVGGAGGTSLQNNSLFVTTTGNVGIGTTTPTYKLHVVGRIKTDVINETSDIRLKKDIQTIDGSLAKVEQLRGVYFKWRSDEFKGHNFDTTRQIGVIAQEIEKIFPEVVSTDADGYKSVEYSKLVAVLIEAIKEQQKIISNIQNENGNLKADLEKIKEYLELRSGK